MGRMPLRGGSLALILCLLAAGALQAQQPAAPAAAGSRAAQAPGFYCPECRAPVGALELVCPQCGTEFEPLVPRVRRGEGPPGAAAPGEPPPAERPAPPPGRGADTSPFPEAQPGVPPPPPRLLESAWPQIQPPAASRFGFGSYGRAGLLVDEELDGAPLLDIVDFRPRLSKLSYQELHFFYRDRIAELPVLIKTTVAADEKIFAFDADFDARIAIRELFAEITPTERLALWMGARMYRGDDIYLLDFWPLDDQNTLGGGVAWQLAAQHRLQLHAGFNRLTAGEPPFFFQRIEIPLEDAVGVRQAVFLDRNRLTASATWRWEPGGGWLVKAHGEFTFVPAARRRLPDGVQTERLPDDHGWLLGAQIGLEYGPQSFARLFATYMRGLGAFDELEVPFGFDTDLTVTEAWKLRLAAGGAHFGGWWGLHWGGYWQRFIDADPNADRDDHDQFALALRPEVYLGEWFRFGLEGVWEGRRPNGIFPETGDEEFGQLASLTVLLGVAAGRGPYARPALYAFAGGRWLDRGARLIASRRLAGEPDAQSAVFGFQAEWWF